MKNDFWEPKRRLENQYQEALHQTTDYDYIQDLIADLTDPFEITARIKNLIANSVFLRYAEAMALKMVIHLFTDTGKTWRQAARENSKGGMIYEALRNELQGSIVWFLAYL